jgi:hypothetical protein
MKRTTARESKRLRPFRYASCSRLASAAAIANARTAPVAAVAFMNYEGWEWGKIVAGV